VKTNKGYVLGIAEKFNTDQLKGKTAKNCSQVAKGTKNWDGQNCKRTRADD